MNWFDCIFMLVLAIFAVIGWRKGLIKTVFLYTRIILSILIVKLLVGKAALLILNISIVKSFFEKVNDTYSEVLSSILKLDKSATALEAPYLTILLITGIIIFVIIFLLLSLIERPLLSKLYNSTEINKKPLRLIGMLFGFLTTLLVMGFFIVGILSDTTPLKANLLWNSVRGSAVSAFVPDKLVGLQAAKKMNRELLKELSDSKVDLVELPYDIPLTDELTIDKPLTIEGSKGKLTGNILIKSPGVVLQNLTVDGTVTVEVDTPGWNTIMDNSIVNGGIIFAGEEAGSALLKNGTQLFGTSIIRNKNFNMMLDDTGRISNLLCREEGIKIEGNGTIAVYESVLVPSDISDNIYVVVRVEAVPGEFIIKFKSSASKKKISAFMKEHSLKEIERIDLVDAYRVRMEGDDPISCYQSVETDKLVSYIESNYRYTMLSEAASDKQFSDALWGLHNLGQEIQGVKGIEGIDISLPEAWDITRGSKEVRVAVIDTGTDINHPDLMNSIWKNTQESRNGIDDDGNGYIDDIHGWDFYGNDNMVYDDAANDLHGTHCSGTIAATGEKSAVFGIAPEIKLLPLKFLGEKPPTLTSILDAINYCRKMGIKISNNSWGGGGRSEALREAIADSGMLFVCAAGNEALDLDVTDFYPASYKLPNMISVAAVDNRGALAGFSNYGANVVHLGAPGVNIFSTAPDGGYQYLSGTSMAAPHVTGIAALIASSGVDDPKDIKQTILDSAGKNPLTALMNTTITGGIANAAVALGVSENGKAPDDILPPAVPYEGDGKPIDTSLITEGAYVEFGTYLGHPVIWQIIRKENEGLLLFSRDIISLKAFDAMGDRTDGRDHVFKHRIKNGSNYWEKSNIREWLNSSQDKVSYSHLSPENSRLAWNKGGYADEAGFLTNFTADEQSLIQPVRHKSILSHIDRSISTREGGSELLDFVTDIDKAGANYNNAYYTFVTDKVFLLSLEELQKYVYHKDFDINGYITAQALQQTDILSIDHDISKPYIYWLRTPLAGGGNSTYYVDRNATLNHAPAYGGNLGLRPALYISYEALRFGDGSQEDPYRFTAKRNEAAAAPLISGKSDEATPVSGLTTAHSRVLDGWGNTSVNALNGGTIGMEDGYIYYVRYSKDILSRIKPDGSGRQDIVGSITSMPHMNVYNGSIYYQGASAIGVVHSDGSLETIDDLCHSSKSGPPINLMIRDDWMYYYIRSSDGKSRIYKMKTDASTRIKLEQLPRKEMTSSLVYTEDGIYYMARQENSNASVFYRLEYDAKGLLQEYGGAVYSNSKRVADTEAAAVFNIFGDRIYYITENMDAVYSINTDGSEKKKLIQLGDYSIFNLYGNFFGSTSAFLCEVDEWIYLNINDKGTCRVKTDGSQTLEVVVSGGYAMALFEDRLYFPNGEGLYSTDLEGRDKIELN